MIEVVIAIDQPAVVVTGVQSGLSVDVNTVSPTMGVEVGVISGPPGQDGADGIDGAGGETSGDVDGGFF